MTSSTRRLWVKRVVTGEEKSAKEAVNGVAGAVCCAERRCGLCYVRMWSVVLSGMGRESGGAVCHVSSFHGRSFPCACHGTCLSPSRVAVAARRKSSIT